MFKKIILTAAGLAVLGFLFLGPAAFSHAGQVFGKAKSRVAEAFPIEYELERAESMVKKIGPEVDNAKRAVAEEQVEIGELEREIVRIEKRADGAEQKVRLQNATLRSSDKSFVVGARTMSRGQLENELRLSFDGMKNDRTLLEAKRRLLEARTGALGAAIMKLEAVRGEESNLRTTIEGLRAQLRHAQAMEACSNKITLDDGALAEAKEILARCRKRIDVASKMIENETGGTLAAPSGPSRDVLAEVDRYFAGPEGEAPSDRGAGATTAAIGGR